MKYFPQKISFSPLLHPPHDRGEQEGFLKVVSKPLIAISGW
jgi:hypothetical protein